AAGSGRPPARAAGSTTAGGNPAGQPDADRQAGRAHAVEQGWRAAGHRSRDRCEARSRAGDARRTGPTRTRPSARRSSPNGSRA
ncbi:hypothetical protein K3V99_14705, partial [Listeria monocytogenes]|nr:hypothetical protein [Listeria monocytogenes]